MKINKNINGQNVEIEITADEALKALSEDDYYFGTVTWEDEDIAQALMASDIEPTPELIQDIRWEVRHIDDAMIDAGWRVIEDAIDEVSRRQTERSNT